ncbi:PREDICTED: uncharacterized protein LOC105561956 isoform X1 [Vollenhovia emeryi]|uniref:uncharacterized protein LOC105561956 isoform X1 n=1 Tax=Vollenhovia emeryi TaxID=411798 RepID=UPI0005F56A13|nr:PREDICTED: uncharacterized protein LOC105561956 isoform X1 [Vollenhovia emeryi]
MKLCIRDINLISKRLKILSKYCPREFNRKPRCLKDFNDYKATEFRQFALYTGPVVMYGILPNDGYLHYLLFHAALRSISQKNSSTIYQRFAEIALKEFVDKCPQFYKLSFISYNVHALLHFVPDVERFGPLDSFSAFKYENNVAFFRKIYRKPSLPLQQIALRLAEMEQLEQVVPNTEHTIKVSVLHDNGPILPELGFVYMQYRKMQMKNMFIGIDFDGDKCCILNDSSICVVYNILKTQYNMYYFIIKKFKTVNAFYDIGILSTCLGIYKCSNLYSKYEVISIDDVKQKCYLMPYWSREESELLVSDSSDNENTEEPSNNIFIAAVII